MKFPAQRRRTMRVVATGGTGRETTLELPLLEAFACFRWPTIYHLPIVRSRTSNNSGGRATRLFPPPSPSFAQFSFFPFPLPSSASSVPGVSLLENARCLSVCLSLAGEILRFQPPHTPPTLPKRSLSVERQIGFHGSARRIGIDRLVRFSRDIPSPPRTDSIFLNM